MLNTLSAEYYMVSSLFLKFLTLNVWETNIMPYANWLDPGQLPSNSAAGLRSNLFATQTTIPH